jgi:CPA1 family monovalent cation:H+ antiporter
LLSITYIVVLSSILVQGLTIGRVVRGVTTPQGASAADAAH